MVQKLDDKTYIKLGKEFQRVLDQNYSTLKPAWGARIKVATVRGFFTGIAGVVGATIGITVLIAILNAFGALPGIGQFFINIANQISSATPSM
jgi:hypothetical protein